MPSTGDVSFSDKLVRHASQEGVGHDDDDHDYVLGAKQRTKRTDNNSGESLLLYTLAPTEVTVLRVSRGVSRSRSSSGSNSSTDRIVEGGDGGEGGN